MKTVRRRLFRARIDGRYDEDAAAEALSSLREDLRPLDLAAEGGFLAFRLADGGSTLRLDRQLLAAQSEYFRVLLSSGCKEAETSRDLSSPTTWRRARSRFLRRTSSTRG